MMTDMMNPGARAGAAGARFSANALQAGGAEDSETSGAKQVALAVIWTGDSVRRVILGDRKLWALRQLLVAGADGVTPMTHPGSCWSGYVRKLRLEGVDSEMIDEAHGGPYAGRHGRYVRRGDDAVEPIPAVEGWA